MSPKPHLNGIPVDNILYSGNEAKACLNIIEEFTSRLLEIERHYSGWFKSRTVSLSSPEKLQHYIQYRFEDCTAVFKFRNEAELPEDIRNECLKACRDVAVCE